jgi:hypothetical protein
VRLMKANGQTVAVPLEKLCKEDQEFVKSTGDMNPFEDDKAKSFRKSAVKAPCSDAYMLGFALPGIAILQVAHQTAQKQAMFVLADVSATKLGIDIPAALRKDKCSIDVFLRTDLPAVALRIEKKHGAEAAAAFKMGSMTVVIMLTSGNLSSDLRAEVTNTLKAKTKDLQAIAVTCGLDENYLTDFAAKVSRCPDQTQRQAMILEFVTKTADLFKARENE